MARTQPPSQQGPFSPGVLRDQSVGLINIATPGQVTEMRRLRADQKQDARIDSQESLSKLVSNLRRKWLHAKQAKQTIEREMIDCFRQRNSQYSPEEITEIEEAGKFPIYPPITEKLCYQIEGEINKMLFQAGESPFDLQPTPIADMPPAYVAMAIQQALADAVQLFEEQGLEVTRQDFEMHIQNRVMPAVRLRLQEEAKLRASRMKKKIEDQFQEGGFYKAARSFVSNLVTFHTAFLKGPVVRKKRLLKYPMNAYGRVSAVLIDQDLCTYEAPSPMDMFFSADATNEQDGDTFERMRMRPQQLRECMGIPGFRNEELKKVIAMYDRGVREWTNSDEDRAELENRENSTLATMNTIDVLDAWTSVPGQELIDERIYFMPNGEPIEADRVYEINAWFVKDCVPYLAVNDHPLGLRPYGSASYEKVPGSVWGKSVPMKIKAPQAMCCGAILAISDNAAKAAGFQKIYNDVDRLADGEAIETTVSGQVHQFTNERNSNLKPLDFFQPDMHVAELQALYDRYMQEANDILMAMPYPAAAGTDRTPAGFKTATGISIVASNAAAGRQTPVSHIDEGMIAPIVYLQFVYNMRYVDDPSIKGDVMVVPRGAMSLVIKEQTTQSRRQFLAEASQNPIIMQLIGLRGFAKILRGTIGTSIDFDPDDIMLTDEDVIEMEKVQAEMAARQQQENPGDPAEPQGEQPGVPRGGGQKKALPRPTAV